MRNIIGTTFPNLFIGVGIALLLVSLLSMNLLLILILFPLGIIILTGRYGVEIDFDRMSFREYNSILFFRWGKWRNLNKFSRISISKHQNHSLVYFSGSHSFSIDESKIAVYMISKNQRVKIPVKVFKDRQLALDFAHKLANTLGFEFG